MYIRAGKIDHVRSSARIINMHNLKVGRITARLRPALQLFTVPLSASQLQAAYRSHTSKGGLHEEVRCPRARPGSALTYHSAAVRRQQRISTLHPIRSPPEVQQNAAHANLDELTSLRMTCLWSVRRSDLQHARTLQAAGLHVL